MEGRLAKPAAYRKQVSTVDDSQIANNAEMVVPPLRRTVMACSIITRDRTICVVLKRLLGNVNLRISDFGFAESNTRTNDYFYIMGYSSCWTIGEAAVGPNRRLPPPTSTYEDCK